MAAGVDSVDSWKLDGVWQFANTPPATGTHMPLWDHTMLLTVGSPGQSRPVPCSSVSSVTPDRDHKSNIASFRLILSHLMSTHLV